jgi:superfamily II DNA or RNA helicase
LTLPIITADQRLAEPRGIKGCIFGKSGIGKTSLLWTLAHRDELTDQNRGKFARVNPGLTTSVVDANGKSWAGQVTFAMVPTLARIGNLAAMPKLDLLVIDEAHHAVAASYRRIIDHVRNANPDARIFGVTATPNRGDRKGLREVFDNVADQVRLGELIASGHLVPPRTFVIDVGVQDKLRTVRKTLADFDMGEVASIMDRAPVTDEVIRHWKEKAQEAGATATWRQTVVFCSTVAHAAHVASYQRPVQCRWTRSARRTARRARFRPGSPPPVRRGARRNRSAATASPPDRPVCHRAE